MILRNFKEAAWSREKKEKKKKRKEKKKAYSQTSWVDRLNGIEERMLLVRDGDENDPFYAGWGRRSWVEVQYL
jgi:hypothetical protein